MISSCFFLFRILQIFFRYLLSSLSKNNKFESIFWWYRIVSSSSLDELDGWGQYCNTEGCNARDCTPLLTLVFRQRVLTAWCVNANTNCKREGVRGRAAGGGQWSLQLGLFNPCFATPSEYSAICGAEMSMCILSESACYGLRKIQSQMNATVTAFAYTEHLLPWTFRFIFI